MRNVVLLTDEQLIKLRDLVRKLLRGESVKMNIYDEKDKAGGEKLLKALKPHAKI